MRKYLQKAGDEPHGRKHGIHALRHSFTQTLLDANTPPPIIAEILGHESSETTKEYLRIDIKKLRQLSMEVPNGQ